MRASYLPLARAQHLKRKYLLLARVPRHRFAVDDGARDVIAKRVAHARDDVRVFGRVVLLVATVYVNGTVFVEMNLKSKKQSKRAASSVSYVFVARFGRGGRTCARSPSYLNSQVKVESEKRLKIS